jgi:hypothetical protein
MIRYTKIRAELEALIEAESPGWLQRAAVRTEEFKRKRKFPEKSSIWSEIKPVYMRLQGNSKCAYCERKLESVDYGKGEQHTDHYRPKRRIKVWPVPVSLKALDVPFEPAPVTNYGYYMMAYHPLNYAAACNPCNSVLKRDYFPIAGKYEVEGTDPSQMLTEMPYLIYPIGDVDEPAEQLIQFFGPYPHPATSTSGYRRNRALVTIKFFDLEGTKRKNLFRERLAVILTLFPQLEEMRLSKSDIDRAEAGGLVAAFTDSNSAHTNCARSFKRLYDAQPMEAREMFRAARKLMSSGS